jgi:hypothetical protein
VVSPGNSLKPGNSNDNGFITMTDSYTTGWDTTITRRKILRPECYLTAFRGHHFQ